MSSLDQRVSKPASGGDGSPLGTERVCSSDHLKSVAFGFSWSFSRNQCKHMCWVDEKLQEGTLKSNDVVFHHDGQCHDFYVIYDMKFHYVFCPYYHQVAIFGNFFVERAT